MSNRPPNAAKLYEAALLHLSRYAATERSLAQVLARRIDRWARLYADKDTAPEEIQEAISQAEAAIPGTIRRLRESGVLNDAAFATSRAKRLTREGKSRRATLAHLAAKGVMSPSLPEDPARELAAACAFLRRRRAGPFGDAPDLKILASMARGGFSQEIARQALRLDRAEAEALIKTLHE
ncbi:MAG: RecX family transcriptional regulator [Acidocella sp.]|nr:RecX family transcriptional regulator [Acidocella sp.]